MPSRPSWKLFLAAGLVATAAGSGSRAQTGGPPADPLAQAARGLLDARQQFAPDPHLAIFTVGLQARRDGYALTGEVDRVEASLQAVHAVARAGLRASNEIRLLPDPALGVQLRGICSLSVAGGREQPAHAAELGTQLLMGEVVRLWKQAATTNGAPAWFLAQSSDGYLSWIEEGTFVRCAEAEAQAWEQAPLLLVTTLEDQVFEQANSRTQPVSDVVVGDRLRRLGEAGKWFRVALPDGRAGFLSKTAAEPYPAWQASRRPTPEHVEQTARRFIGRPYLWGGSSPKGLDCSGFTKLVFFLNGIPLQRNASEQAKQGREIPIAPGLTRLRKGDLLFFGPPAREDRPEKIVHTGIYLGDQLFIHSLGRVHLSSLDPRSPITDEFRLNTLRHVRRVIPESP